MLGKCSRYGTQRTESSESDVITSPEVENKLLSLQSEPLTSTLDNRSLSYGHPFKPMCSKSPCRMCSFLAFSSSTSQFAHNILPFKKLASALASQTQNPAGRSTVLPQVNHAMSYLIVSPNVQKGERHSPVSFPGRFDSLEVSVSINPGCTLKNLLSGHSSCASCSSFTAASLLAP